MATPAAHNVELQSKTQVTLDALESLTLMSVSVKTANNAYYKTRQATQVREKFQNVVGKHERAAGVGAI